MFATFNNYFSRDIQMILTFNFDTRRIILPIFGFWTLSPFYLISGIWIANFSNQLRIIIPIGNYKQSYEEEKVKNQ